MRVTQQKTFAEIVASFKIDPPIHLTRVMAIDPGETSGIALFKGTMLYRVAEIDHRKHKDIGRATDEIGTIIKDFKPTALVVEDYTIYKTHTKVHTNSTLFTPRLIGGIEFLAKINEIPLKKQMASVAKAFMTDTKLKDWKFWIKGQRHARDAVRHGATYILFQTKKAAKGK